MGEELWSEGYRAYHEHLRQHGYDVEYDGNAVFIRAPESRQIPPEQQYTHDRHGTRYVRAGWCDWIWVPDMEQVQQQWEAQDGP